MKKKDDYKGLFYADIDTDHKSYEGGAHFRYIDLFNILTRLCKRNSTSKKKKEIKKNSLSQGKNKNKNNSNSNMSMNNSKNKSSKNIFINEEKKPFNFLINYNKKKLKNNEENKSKSKSKCLNNSHNYNNQSKLGITQLLNLKINNNRNLYNISDLENNSKFSNISKLKEKKIIFDNVNIIKHQPKSRNSQDKKIITKTNNNNICDYYNNNYNYFFVEQKIDKIKEKDKNIMTNKSKKIISSHNNNTYLDYFKITKITPRSRGSINKNTVMLNIRRLKNKNNIQNSLYNINDNSNMNISNKSNSFVKKRKNRLSYDHNNSKISKIGYRFSTNTTYGEEFISKKIKNNFTINKSPILNNSLNKKKTNMTLLTVNKTDENKKQNIIESNNNNSKSKITKNKNKKLINVNNNTVLKYINHYIVKGNKGFKRQNSKNTFFYSYRNKYIINNLQKKISDNTYNNILKKNKNDVNVNVNKNKIQCKMSSRNSVINNNNKIL